MVWLGASCSDSATAPRDATAASGPFLLASVSAPSPQTVYVSLPSGTIPGGTEAQLRVERTGATATARLVDGGLDPVALAAVVGDVVAIDVQAAGTHLSYALAVPKPSRPVVVRTSPPPHKRDVSLNASMVVVFSEPIAPATLTGTSVRLLKGGVAVAGTLAFADVAHTSARFVPAAPLEAETNYELVVTDGIRDLDGMALDGDVTVEFTTADAAPPPDGAIELVAATTGSDLDPDGYGVQIARPDFGTSAALPSNGTVTTPALAVGTYTVTLGGVAANCTVAGDGAARTVAVAGGATTRVSFEVLCAPVPPPPNTASGELAFVRDGQIFTTNLLSNTPKRLTSDNSGLEGSPAWSPDGRRIAFTRGGWSPELYLVDADGSHLVHRADDFRFPAWSPDGRRLAVNRGDCIYFCDIFLMSVDEDGTAPVRVATQARFPAWSPDGKRIAFVGLSGDDGYHELQVMNADGSGVKVVVPTDGGSIQNPSWSPDGRRIAFSRCTVISQTEAACNVFIVNPDGTGLVQLTALQDPLLADGVAWSPDGTRIAFTLEHHVSSSVYEASVAYVPADGGGAPVTIVSRGYSPAWRPAVP